LSKEQVIEKSQEICRQVLEREEYKNSGTIFAYYPLGNEVNCLPVIEQALRDGKRLVLPRTGRDYRMEFYEIKGLEDVEEGNFHVMEPKADCKIFLPHVPVMEQKCTEFLVIVPGVVFDHYGNRYGYGKGYYDRYFARFPHLIRMGLAYTEQLSEESLECLETDVKMHIIVTENTIIRTSREHSKI